MIKAQIVDTISQKTGIEKTVVKVTVDTLMERIVSSLSHGEDVFLRGFGSFVVKKRSEKNFHAAPGKWILIPEHNEPFFRPCDEFKELIKKNVK
jgi:DNA-binding protein HU-beta